MNVAHEVVCDWCRQRGDATNLTLRTHQWAPPGDWIMIELIKPLNTLAFCSWACVRLYAWTRDGTAGAAPV